MTFGNADPNANAEMNGKFILEIDNVALGAYTKVTTSRSEWGKMPDRTGPEGLDTNEASGLKKPYMVKFEKDLKVGGVADIAELLTWHEQGSLDKRSASIILQDRGGSELMRWNYSGCWVSAIDEIELDAVAENASVKFAFEMSAAKLETVQA